MGVVIKFPHRPVLIEDIISETCDQFEMTYLQFVGERRTKQYTEARFAACFLAQHMTGESFVQIGKRMRRDHSTIIHAAERGAELYADRQSFREAVDEIRNRVMGNRSLFKWTT